jgi:hypothetical protein
VLTVVVRETKTLIVCEFKVLHGSGLAFALFLTWVGKLFVLLKLMVVGLVLFINVIAVFLLLFESIHDVVVVKSHGLLIESKLAILFVNHFRNLNLNAR